VIYEPLALAGQFDEALAQIENTREKFPAWKGWRGSKALLYGMQEDWDEALAVYEDVDPDDLPLDDKVVLVNIFAKLGRMDEARALFEENRAEAEKDSLYSSLASLAYTLGDTATSLSYLEIMKKTEPSPLINIAYIHTLHGDMDQAFACLEEAYDRKINWVTRLGILPKVNPGWAPIADDPRYEPLMKKIGIRE